MLAHAIVTTSPEAWFYMGLLFTLVVLSMLVVFGIENNYQRPPRRRRRRR